MKQNFNILQNSESMLQDTSNHSLGKSSSNILVQDDLKQTITGVSMTLELSEKEKDIEIIVPYVEKDTKPPTLQIDFETQRRCLKEFFRNFELEKALSKIGGFGGIGITLHRYKSSFQGEIILNGKTIKTKFQKFSKDEKYKRNKCLVDILEFPAATALV